MQNVVFVCVFRDVASTAASIMKECTEAPYLRDLTMTFPVAIEVWTLMYQHVLRVHRNDGEWVFVHFNQILSGEGIVRLEKHLQVQGDNTFPDRSLRRSSSTTPIPEATVQIYEELCEAAGYQDEHEGERT